MSLKLTAVTANCGNGGIGNVAAEKIISSNVLKHNEIVVLNLQEVHQQLTIEQLQKQLEKYNQEHQTNFKIAASELMVTRTKLSLDTLFNKTGISSLVVYDADQADVKFESSTVVRRQPNPLFYFGSKVNKGGLISNLTVAPKDGSKPTKLQVISGHLESFHPYKRLIDWLNLRKHLSFEAQTWQQLVSNIPTARLAGYDANTRNVFQTSTSQSLSPWATKSTTGDSQALYMSALGQNTYSDASTYKDFDGKALTTTDAKRPGCMKGGALDFVACGNYTAPSSLKTESPIKGGSLYQPASIKIPPSKKEKRDHAVLLKTGIELHTDVDEFQIIQNYLVEQLCQAAPSLAQEIEQLSDSSENREKLLKAHNVFLSPNGLINQRLRIASETCANHNGSTLNEGEQLAWFLNASLAELDVYQELYELQAQITLLKSELNIGGFFTPSMINKEYALVQKKLDELIIKPRFTEEQKEQAINIHQQIKESLKVVQKEYKSNIIFKVMSLFGSKPIMPDFSHITAKISTYLKKATIKPSESSAHSQSSYTKLSASDSTLAKGSKKVIELQERQTQQNTDTSPRISTEFKL